MIKHQRLLLQFERYNAHQGSSGAACFPEKPFDLPLYYLQVLQEPGIPKHVLKERAKGLKKLGAIFEVCTSVQQLAPCPSSDEWRFYIQCLRYMHSCTMQSRILMKVVQGNEAVHDQENLVISAKPELFERAHRCQPHP